MRKKTICLLITTMIVLSIFPLIPRTKAQTEPTVSLEPSTTQVTELKQTFTLNITISNVQNLWLWNAEITWNPAVLNMTNTPQEGDFMTQAGSTMFIAVPPRNGTVPDITDTLLSSNGASGSGVLATLGFQVIGQSASTSVQLSNLSLEAPLPSGSTTGAAHPTITPTSTSSTATVNFVQGGAPAANAGPDQTVTQGNKVTFDGSKSISSGSNPTYTWSFMYNGVLQTLSGVNATYTFNTPGIYTVTLTLKDSNGSSNSTMKITVNNKFKPVAVINVEGVSNGQAQAGQPITFNGTGSYELNNGTITRYLWDVGGISIGTTPTITYNFTIPTNLKSETENVTLTVFDATNQKNTTATQITVVPSSSPTPKTSLTPTSTPSSTSTATTAPTSTPPLGTSSQAGVPPYVVAITVIITVLVLAGSTIWLRKRT